MAGLQITITDAGRAALPNGPNTGTSAVTISHVAVSSVHTAGSLKGLTTLPGEVKRVTTFGGDIVADDVIHITINDETTDVYSVRAFGLYLSTGVLFAVFSSPDVVVEKSAGAMVLLSADITFKTLDTAVIQFGGTGFINPPATTERLGVVELATWEESAAGSRADVVVTPFGLLKTLQSWATNFAAAVHRHPMTAIDDLPEALASKSAVGHKHDASDTNSGVFDVGRIPALGMEKITGLANALANRAALIHGHVMSDIDGLVQALNGKSAIGHKHDASDTFSGTFDVGRIPALAMEKITGLATALASKAASIHGHVISDIDGLGLALSGKSAVGHKHDASDTVSGTFDVGRIPALAMEKITGLATALASKANKDSPTFTGTMRHSGSVLEMPGEGSFFGFNMFYDGGWRRRAADRGWAVRHSGDALDVLFLPNGAAGGVGAEVSALRLNGQNGGAAIGGANVWTTSNLLASSAGEAAAGSASDRFITPAALFSFARNLGSTGYAVIPGTGLMVQWGLISSSISEGFTHAGLPVAFGGGCLVALAIPRNAGAVVTADWYMQMGGKYQDRIVFYANRANGGTGSMDGYEWLALGRVSGSPDPTYTSGGGGGGGGGNPEIAP